MKVAPPTKINLKKIYRHTKKVYGKIGYIALLLFASIQLSHGAEEYRYAFSDFPLIKIDTQDFGPPVADFLRSAARAGVIIEIKNCESMYRMQSNDNFSYVASCTLKNGYGPVMLCNDQLAGHFALTATFGKSPEAMAKFLWEHCTGG